MTLYKKIGRKYYPEKDDSAITGLSNGSWLVVVKEGTTAIRELIQPAYSEVETCLMECQDEMAVALYEASAAKLSLEPMTKRQQKAWEEMQAAFGGKLHSLKMMSAYQITEVGLGIIRKKIKENNCVNN